MAKGLAVGEITRSAYATISASEQDRLNLFVRRMNYATAVFKEAQRLGVPEEVPSSQRQGKVAYLAHGLHL